MSRTLVILAALLAIHVTLSSLRAGPSVVKVSRGQIVIPTYPWTAVKHPYFRGTDGLNIYPYPMLDFLSREKTNRVYRTVALENEYLRVTFLPELGGKVHEVIDKTTGQPMFYVNHVIKPALIGQCGAWTSGGIEWNTGPQGHTVGCMQPIAVEILPRATDGSQSVAIGETERIYRTKWTVVVTLRPGRSFIEERIRIYNPTETVRPYYFWNCTAVPNTAGFRFIYPMTLGTDHGAERFFNWPIHEGKDLSRGTNYQDASSIFAWHCDQDFFGSYNNDLDRGVVACGNHQLIPGKKAWTWGWGGYGTMHQADLTDDDGPYNEVQTGPLLTQGEVGRLDPCEAIEWREWWYPIHGIGGFTFANTNLAANLCLENGKASLSLMATASWPKANVVLTQGDHILAQAACALAPARPTSLEFDVGDAKSFLVGVSGGKGSALAEWAFPVDPPVRRPPEKKEPPKTASEHVATGWQHFLFARFQEAESHFRKALDQDSQCRDARVGLAHLELDRDPLKAVEEARAAVDVAPNHGPAHYILAAAAARCGLESAAAGNSDQARKHGTEAIDEAWKAALDPASAVAARALIAKLLLLDHGRAREVLWLAERGPWQTDPVFGNRLAFSVNRYAVKERPERALVENLARQNLAEDPLDYFARCVLTLDRPEREWRTCLAGVEVQELIELDAQFQELGGGVSANMLAPAGAAIAGNVMAYYRFKQSPGPLASLGRNGVASVGQPPAPRPGDWPSRYEDVSLLRSTVAGDPADGCAVLFLGHALFHLGRHDEGRQMWKRAAELGYEPAIAYRALGMAAKTLDGDVTAARAWLQKAIKADPKDAIVARDLARVLFELADKASSDAEKQALAAEARDRLQPAFDQGKGRSDFVALLGRSLSRLGDHAATARLLDSVRITIWEGAREAHDLFEEAHLALGEDHLKAGRVAEALAEFNCALEYPANLATGRLENAREAHIHYLRGNALAALGRSGEAVVAWKKAAEEPASGDPKKDEARQKARNALEESGH